MLSCVQKLKDGMVLIFDEAQHLNLKTIEVLRSFSDYFADRSQIQRSDIEKLFPILVQENKELELDFLLQTARTPQALRGAINLFSNAYDNEDYSYAGLVAMAKFMSLEV